jgi:hypothetical protein
MQIYDLTANVSSFEKLTPETAKEKAELGRRSFSAETFNARYLSFEPGAHQYIHTQNRKSRQKVRGTLSIEISYRDAVPAKAAYDHMKLLERGLGVQFWSAVVVPGTSIKSHWELSELYHSPFNQCGMIEALIQHNGKLETAEEEHLKSNSDMQNWPRFSKRKWYMPGIWETRDAGGCTYGGGPVYHAFKRWDAFDEGAIISWHNHMMSMLPADDTYFSIRVPIPGTKASLYYQE